MCQGEGLQEETIILKHYVDICNIVGWRCIRKRYFSTDLKSMIKEGEEWQKLHEQNCRLKVPMIKGRD